MEKTLTDSSTLTKYPLKLAQNCINRYVQNVSRKTGIETKYVIRAYTVSSQDALLALGVQEEYATPYSSFRAYLGLEDADINGTIVEQYKLFLVPIDNATQCDDIPADENGDQYVFDFNTPCPNTCDFGSPLYLAGDNLD